MKQKLAFIDHSFHQKTNASFFLIEILKKEYDVEIFRDESWNRGSGVNLKKIADNEFNPIVFFQMFRYPEEEIKSIEKKNVILVPMFDACPRSSDYSWKNFSRVADVKFLNFSKTLHEKFTTFGFRSQYCQYFPPADSILPKSIDNKALSGFFWQRTGRLTWKQIKKLIKNTGFKEFFIHTAADPPGCAVVLPTEEEKKKFNINLTEWFADKKEYLDLVRKTNVFFAPRLSEGIGMSFLEAMAMGKCVVAADNPTMNEYIEHGVTGLLYDPKRPRALDFSNIPEISGKTRRFIEEGHKKWRDREQELLDFIKQPAHQTNSGMPLKLKPITRYYFRYRQMIYYLKELTKKTVPGFAKALSRLKRWLTS